MRDIIKAEAGMKNHQGRGQLKYRVREELEKKNHEKDNRIIVLKKDHYRKIMKEDTRILEE